MIYLYAALKLLAYSGWCWVGLGLFRPGGERRLPSALAFGVARLFLGLGFGVAIYLLASAVVAASRSQPLAYAAVYVPVRWIEWAIIDTLMRREPASISGFALGPDVVTRGWRTRGVLLSCLADIPVILAVGGLPVGRFLC